MLPDITSLTAGREGSLLMKLLLNNRVMALVTLSQLVRVLGRSVAWIFTPLYLADYYHDTFFQIGALFFLSALVSLPVSVYGGNLIDRVGRRLISVLLPVVSASIFLGLFVTSLLPLPALVVYVLFIAVYPVVDLEGIADNVMLSDVVPPEQRNDAYSITRISANVGFAIGPAIGGFVALYGFGDIYLIPCFTSFAIAVVYAFKMIETRPESTKPSGKMSFPFDDRSFVYFAILISMAWFVAGQWGTTLTLFLSHAYNFTTMQIGILYSVNGIMVIVLQMPLTFALRKFTDLSRISLGALIYGVSFFAFALTSNFAYLLLVTVVLTIAENIMAPSSQTLIARLAPEERRGEYFGAFGAIGGLIIPISPLFGTFALGFLISTPLLFWSIFLCMGIALSIVLRISGRLSGRV